MSNCSDCQLGEHDNYDDDVRKCIVVDPDDGRVTLRGLLCESHRTMYEDDGYEVLLP